MKEFFIDEDNPVCGFCGYSGPGDDFDGNCPKCRNDDWLEYRDFSLESQIELTPSFFERIEINLDNKGILVGNMRRLRVFGIFDHPDN